MKKYIDADKLRSVLQNTINSMKEKDVKGERYDAFLNGKLSICEELLGCIDSLQQEQPEVDEDFFFDEILKVYDGNNKYPPRNEEELTMLETVARHFYELGLNARKK